MQFVRGITDLCIPCKCSGTVKMEEEKNRVFECILLSSTARPTLASLSFEMKSGTLHYISEKNLKFHILHNFPACIVTSQNMRISFRSCDYPWNYMWFFSSRL